MHVCEVVELMEGTRGCDWDFSFLLLYQWACGYKRNLLIKTRYKSKRPASQLKQNDLKIFWYDNLINNDTLPNNK